MQEKYEIPKSCAQCRHFHQHYVRVAGYRYAPLDEGHCSEPRCRDKRADDPACARFSKRPEPRR